MTTPHGAPGSQPNGFGNPYGSQPGAHGSQPGGYGSQPGSYGSQPGAYGSQPGAYGSQPQQGYGNQFDGYGGHSGFGAPAGPPLRGPHPINAYGNGSAGYWKASQDDKTMAMLSHLGALFFGFLVPLIVFLIKKDESSFIREHTRQALNLQITFIIASFVSGLLTVVFIGAILLPAVVVAALVLEIIAAVKAYNGEMYKMPLVFNIIK